MPARILGFDFSRASQTVTSPLLKPISDKKHRPSFGRSITASSDEMDKLKRPTLGLPGKHHSNEKRAKSPSEKRDGSVPRGVKNIKIDVIAESPPALFLDPPQQSSGALYSGRLQLHVRDAPITLDSFCLEFRATTSTKKPVSEHCKDCASKTTNLREWKFLTEPVTFKPGVHDFPFSYLIPGHLPATTHGHIGHIDYYLYSRATASTGEFTEYTRPVVITRAIRQGNDKHSVRIFPPTNLTLNVTVPNVIHPIGDFPVYARMSGITTKREDTNTQTRWRLRKLTWRIEEHEHMVSPACAKHAGKVGGEGKGIAHEHVRDIGYEELKSGWKTDFEDGQLEGEFSCFINHANKPQCDVESPSGLKISHQLVLELVIAEEWAPNKKPNQATPTGAARVLRTTFNVTVTERSGMGIAWDDEQPPMYEDVPASPPGYVNVEDYTGEDLNADVEHLQLGH
ncbi:Endocytosis regulator [Zalaria obscura]|uniref:Endocytosis regulator n=1 Tax=Zalaria obscura TaxID=2024903 RepID=A0ACC3SNC8_9PEZI